MAESETGAAVASALWTVATADGSTPLSRADRRGISSAMETVFGLEFDLDPDGLSGITSGELVDAVVDPGTRLDLVRVLAVLALLDGVVERDKLVRVIDVASALHVHAEFVDALHQLSLDHVGWVAHDMIRANVATIPGVPWVPTDPYAPFLPYGGDGRDPVLAGRFEHLAELEAGTLGRAFYDHYRLNGYAFAGRPEGLIDAWATPHDCLHVLSGYSTSAQGELLVAAFTGGMLAPPIDAMESHVLPTILIYHLGIDLNKGLNAGDRERLAADPSWADNYDGNVHLGLDAAKLWTAWQRGAAMTEDLYSGHWDFWDHAATPVTKLRQAWGVAPLPPDLAALPDDAIDRSDFTRAGQPEPPAISTVAISDRPHYS